MSPQDQYGERLAGREANLAKVQIEHQRIGSARLALAAAFLLVAWFSAVRLTLSPHWLLLPSGLFIGIVLYHTRVRTRLGNAQRAVEYYRAGIQRLRGIEVEHGPTGDSFRAEQHLYAMDLDLFGRHSLYQRLCTARTPMGENRLAQWLLKPADLGTIRERQQAIIELRDRLDLREDLAILGDVARLRLQSDAISAWLTAPNTLSSTGLRATASTLVALAAASAIVWSVWGIASPFLLILVVEVALHYALRHRVQQCVAGIEAAYEDLKLISTLLQRIEVESFVAPGLRALANKLQSNTSPSHTSRAQGFRASATLSKLATLVNFVEARRNPFLTPILLPLLYTLHAALAVERWRARHGAAVANYLDVLGEIEALQSLATQSFEHPEDSFPEFMDGPPTFIATGLGHPLLAAETCVRNDVELSETTRVLLVSGSNMSGKSTLLRSIGINTVLAMAGAPVRARKLLLTPLQVGASIRVNDSLYEGSSRFYAEITRLRQLFDPAPLPLLFLLDELLQGTNSTDRRIGAQGVLRALLARGAIGGISTHDLSLTDNNDLVTAASGSGTGASVLRNMHFQDEIIDGKLTFDFQLREGVVTKSNGIELMRAIGLDV